MSKTKYEIQTDAFVKDLEEVPGLSQEFAVSFLDGGIVALHKRVFANVKNLQQDVIYFEDCCSINGRGTASLTHVTPGSFLPKHPSKVDPLNAKTIQNLPYMNRVVVLSGGDYLDKSETLLPSPMTDDKIQTFCRSVVKQERPREFLSSAYGILQAMDHAVLPNVMDTIYEQYFPDIPEGERKDYLIYVFGTAEVMASYVISVYPRKLEIKGDRSAIFDQQNIDDTVYVHPSTLRVAMNNKRLNIEGEPLALVKPLIHGTNRSMIRKTEKEVFDNILGVTKRDTAVEEFNKLHRDVLCVDQSEYTKLPNDQFLANQMASIVLSHFQTPFNLEVEVPSPEVALNARMNFVLKTMIRCEESFNGVVSAHDELAAAVTGQVLCNQMSPGALMTYRDDGDISNPSKQMGRLGTQFPWFQTDRTISLMNRAGFLKYMDENEKEMDDQQRAMSELATAMDMTSIQLATLFDFYNIFRAEQFISKTQLFRDSGNPLKQKDEEDLKSQTVKMGQSMLIKELDRPPQRILALLYCDPNMFKRLFLQYGMYLLENNPSMGRGVPSMKHPKDDTEECNICKMPYYTTIQPTGDEGISRVEFCMCYFHMKVVGKLTDILVNNKEAVGQVEKLYDIKDSNPFCGPMTSMKLLFAVRAATSLSRIGDFGGCKLKPNKEDGFGMRFKRNQKARERGQAVTTDKSIEAHGTNSNLAKTSSHTEAVDKNSTIKNVVTEQTEQNSSTSSSGGNDGGEVAAGPAPSENSEAQKSDSWMETIAMNQILANVRRNFPSMLSEHQSTVEPDATPFLNYMNEVVRKPMTQDSGAVECGTVRLHPLKAIVHAFTTDARYSGESTALFVQHGSYTTSGPIGTGRDSRSSRTRARGESCWSDTSAASEAKNGNGKRVAATLGDDGFKWQEDGTATQGPDAKKSKLLEVTLMKQEMERFVRAVTHACLVKGVKDKTIQEMSKDELVNKLSPEIVAHLNQWGALSRQGVNVGRLVSDMFSRYFAQVFYPKASDGVIDRMLELYLDNSATTIREIHADVAKTLNMTPEELDNNALSAISLFSSTDGELGSWLDPETLGSSILKRSELFAYYALVRYLINVRTIANRQPQTLNKHVVEQYMTPKEAPHLKRIIAQVPVYLPKQDAGGTWRLDETASTQLTTRVNVGMPLNMKIEVVQSNLDMDGRKKREMDDDGSGDKRGYTEASAETLRLSSGQAVACDASKTLKPWPLLKYSENPMNSKTAREPGILFKDLCTAANNVKMHCLGLPHTVNPTMVENGIKWCSQYLDQRQDGTQRQMLTGLIDAMMRDFEAMFEPMLEVLRVTRAIVKKYEIADAAEKIGRDIDTLSSKIYDRNKFTISRLSRLFRKKPELIAPLLIMITSSEIYGAPRKLDIARCDREFERDHDFIKGVVGSCIRLINGKPVRPKPGGDPNPKPKEMDHVAVHTTYTGQNILSGKRLLTETYTTQNIARNMVLLAQVNFTSYYTQYTNSDKAFSRVKVNDTFRRNTVTAALAGVPPSGTRKEVSLVITPLAHFPNAWMRGVGHEQILAKLLKGCTIGEFVSIVWSGKPNINKIARYLLKITGEVLLPRDKSNPDILHPSIGEDEVGKVLTEQFWPKTDTDIPAYKSFSEIVPRLHKIMRGQDERPVIEETVNIYEEDDGENYDDEDDDEDRFASLAEFM
ncbi:PREDICTED: uncharacterized protein LOC109473491 [Branchiostoma belcheri]|uniref:Uncharacterized protein LOC109473491 n=1 Tax=Branchiostoma belcheri TaxID=7741 RepID=A0A6P4ZCT9_BRABE|nr:PREDICTED: uncharacterized protein LOC109473491 [Branchiostoma belcheri]